MPLEEADQLCENIANKSKAFANKVKQVVNPLNWAKQYNNIRYAYDSIKEVKEWFDKKLGNDINDDTHTEVKFTGNHTDIANIGMYKDERMPCGEINNIQNEQLKSNVAEEFKLAKQNGYIRIINVDGIDYYELTKKGREYINDENFIKQYEQRQYNAIIGDEPRAEVHFQGKQEDLNIFRYTDKINVSKEDWHIRKFFADCEHYKYLTVDENGFYKPTEKLNEWLKNNPDLMKAKGNIKIFDGNSLRDISSSLNTDEVIKNKSTDIASKGTNVAGKGKNIASNGTNIVNKSKEIAGKGVKVASKGSEIASKGVKVASTGAKVAGTTATTVGVASGAASAGVGTIITISVEAAKKLAEKANQVNQQINQTLKQ